MNYTTRYKELLQEVSPQQPVQQQSITDDIEVWKRAVYHYQDRIEKLEAQLREVGIEPFGASPLSDPNYNPHQEDEQRSQQEWEQEMARRQ